MILLLRVDQTLLGNTDEHKFHSKYHPIPEADKRVETALIWHDLYYLLDETY